jgi:hypothetical protein
MTGKFFDYTRVDWTFVHKLMAENNRRLSRTHHGHSDTGSSELKHPLLLSGQALLQQIERNEIDVHKFVYGQSSAAEPQSSNAVRDILFQIADLTNRGTLPSGRLRTWEIGANQASLTGGPAISGPEAKVSPQRIEAALSAFCDTLWRRWPELPVDPVPVAAWSDWQLNGGEIHPFYDGCGRISRSFAASLLVRARCLLPLFDNKTAYFEAGNRSSAAFVQYYTERIEACRRTGNLA